VRLEHVVQPLRLRPLFKGHMHRDPRPRTSPTMDFASVGTVARIAIEPCSSRTLTTRVA